MVFILGWIPKIQQPVGLNLTEMAYQLLTDGSAKTHIYNRMADTNKSPDLSYFHHLYSYLFLEFDKLWMKEKPQNMNQFKRLRDLFERNVRTLLKDPSIILRIKVSVETV